jgi:hypothetical protein
VIFGNHYKAILSENNVYRLRNEFSRFHPSEISFIREYNTYNNSSLTAACQKQLNLETKYYYAIRHQITSLLKF